ncbi:MAG: hypothetical protein ACHQ4F_15360 [Candidatus Dormibacteria bacterium]
MNAPTVSLAPLMVGTDWISIARWVTVAHGVLTVLGIFAYGLLVPSIAVPVQDPSTGVIAEQTLNIRPFLAILACFVIGLYALVVWLTKYGITRAVMLLVVVLEGLLTLGRMGLEPPTAVTASVVSLLGDAAFAVVLALTFLAPQRRAPVTAPTPQPVVAAAPQQPAQPPPPAVPPPLPPLPVFSPPPPPPPPPA